MGKRRRGERRKRKGRWGEGGREEGGREVGKGRWGKGGGKGGRGGGAEGFTNVGNIHTPTITNTPPRPIHTPFTLACPMRREVPLAEGG